MRGDWDGLGCGDGLEGVAAALGGRDISDDISHALFDAEPGFVPCE